jgi:hypothetical protein
MMKKPNKNYIQVQGEEIPYYRLDNDVNGNPRYLVHFLDLNVKPEDYGHVPGLTKYRAKWFGGGYVFQSYNLESDLNYYLNKVDDFYKED